MNPFLYSFAAALLIGAFAPHAKGEEGEPSAGMLDVSGGSVDRFTTSASMMGTTDTLVFYTFKNRHAVLKVVINNTSINFPFTATLYQFGKDATEEGLGKWVNNQHSDGIFIDAAEPVGEYKVPDVLCSLESKKLIDRTRHHNGEHDNYEVKFRIAAFARNGVFQLKAFTDVAKVHIKVTVDGPR